MIAICPIHDFPRDEGLEWLRHVESESLLVTLALDFADRVVERVQNPAAAKTWLAAARGWDDTLEANLWLDWSQAWAIVQDVPSERSDSEQAAIRAVEEALYTAWCIKAGKNHDRLLKWIAEEAVLAAADGEQEYVWQLEHAQQLACTCLPQAAGALWRGRISLLAG
jgi:hypothetical protein